MSGLAAMEYRSHRYDQPPSCSRPCTSMEVTTNYAFKRKNENKDIDSEVRFLFPAKIKVYTEVEAYQVMSLVADIGGSLGLTLGLSLTDIVKPFNALMAKINGF